MRRTFILIVLLTISVNCLNAQIPVGQLYDVNGIPFDGYFDPLSYAPHKKVVIVLNANNFESGYYYDQSGNKRIGAIKFQNKEVLFRSKPDDTEIQSVPGEIKYLLVGRDSFFIARNINFKDGMIKGPDFVQYITAFDGLTFAKYYHFSSSVLDPIPIKEEYIVKSNDEEFWDNFPDNKTLDNKLLKYFGHIPYLANKIISSDYDDNDILPFIKYAEYLFKFENGLPVHFDKYWQETNDFGRVKFLGRIKEIVDSIWTVDYYEDSIRLYTVNYSSFYPNIKYGDFIAYYPNGEFRKRINYKNNEPGEIRIYSVSGELVEHYFYQENFDTVTVKSKINPTTTEIDTFRNRLIDIKYTTIKDSLGKELSKNNAKYEVKTFDPGNKCYYTRVFENDSILYSYRLMDDEMVFQLSDPNSDFSIEKLQRRLGSYLSNQDFDLALNDNAQGIVLLRFVVDKKGKVKEAEILNQIHPVIDILMNNFIQSKLIPTAKNSIKFKSYKRNKTKCFCEFVVPIEFSINRFYREPQDYSPFYFNHQMMQMNNFKPPTNLQRGF